MIPEELTTRYDTDLLREFDREEEEEVEVKKKDRKSVYRTKGKVGTESDGVRSVEDELRKLDVESDGINKTSVIIILVLVCLILLGIVIFF